MRTSALVFGICFASATAGAQQIERWSVAVGPVMADMRYQFSSNNISMGGGGRAGLQFWHDGPLSAGVELRAAGLDAMQDCVNVGFSPTSCYKNTHITSIFGIGPSLQYKRTLRGATSWLARAVVEPTWGHLNVFDSLVMPAENPFSTLYGGLAVGVQRGRFRLEFEGGRLNKVRVSSPSVWNLQLVFTP